jgi:hypothetical protein
MNHNNKNLSFGRFLKHQKSMTSTDENLGFGFGLVQKCDGVE